MTLIEKTFAGLMIWILALIATMLTIGTYKFATEPRRVRIDCTTHNFNPDATKEQKELCRSTK